MLRVLVAVFCLSIVFATGASAQQGTRNDELNDELTLTDKQLNKTYQTVLSQLSPADQAALRTAQRAWVKFRDADCVFVGPT